MFRRRGVSRRGPGLLGTAVVGGLAFSAGRSGARQAAEQERQNQQIADLQAQQQAAPPPTTPTVTSTDDRIRQLQELAKLKAAGVLTDADVEREKDRILRSG